MRFISDGPDIPDQLIQQHEEGDVVLFCGAGISDPAGLPGFEGLSLRLFHELGETPTAPEAKELKRQRYDVAIDLLERRIGDWLRVRRQIAEILKPDLTLPGASGTHQALLTLARARDDRVRLVTTNFDRVFELVAGNVQSYQAPHLPIPKKSKWDGITYLHGLLPRTNDPLQLRRLVVSSGDFGQAYLTERWASRFVSDLFRTYTVCFIGYSINDPVMRYMMDALSADRMAGDATFDVYAFGSYTGKNERSVAEEWDAKGVIPILYRERRKPNAHTLLHQSIAEWAKVYRDGLSGKQAILTREASAPPSPVVGDGQVGRVLWALCDASGVPAKFFAEMQPPPPIDWLKAFDQSSYRLSDLPRFGIDPRRSDEEVEFSVINRPTPHRYAPRMALAFSGSAGGSFDDVMFHLARWLTMHLDKRELLSWIIRRGGCLHPQIAALIDNQLAKASLPEPLATVWRCFVTGRVACPRRSRNVFMWKKRAARYGYTPSIRLELIEMFRPLVRFSDPYEWPSIEGSATVKQARVLDFVNWEIELSAEHLQSELKDVIDQAGGRKALVDLLPDATRLLRDAMDLMRELGGADKHHDRSYIVQPSISPHPQNKHYHDWTALIELCRDAWAASAELDIDAARSELADWQRIQYPVFRRLVLYAATYSSVVSPCAALDLLLADGGWWLWSVETQREASRLLAALATTLDATDVARLCRSIQTGPPLGMFADDLEPERLARSIDRDRWLLLEKLKRAGGRLTPEAKSLHGQLQSANPVWKLQPEDQDEFPVWSDEGSSWRRHVTLPRDVEQLVSALVQRPKDDFWYDDDWKDTCRNDPDVALKALEVLAGLDLWPIDVWGEALQVFGEEQLVQRGWNGVAQLLRRAPGALIGELQNGLSWFLRSSATIVSEETSTFFMLVGRVLDASKDEQPVIAGESTQEDDDIVSRAINHPVGHVTDAVIRWWFATQPRDQQGLPDRILSTISRIADDEVPIFRYGRLVLASQLVALFRVDADWTRATLLPRFAWQTNEAEAQAVWEGFLWTPRLHRGLMESFKNEFLSTAPYCQRLGQFGEQYASLLTLAALELQKLFSEVEVHRALSLLPPRGLLAAAQMLVRAMSDAQLQAPAYWQNRVGPFIRTVWPKSNSLKSGGISIAMARVAILSGIHFAAAFELVQGLIIRARDTYLAVRDLAATDLCRIHPDKCLQLLDLLIDDRSSYADEELCKCLEMIVAADPELTKTGAFLRLQTFTKRRG